MMTTINKAAVGWTMVIVAIALIFIFYSLVIPTKNDIDKDGVIDIDDNCPEIKNPDQKDYDKDNAGVGGKPTGDACDSTPYGEEEELDETLTMENVIAMRVLRIDYLLNYLNDVPDLSADARVSYTKELSAIKDDINNTSVSAYNKMYQFQTHFDGKDESIVSNTKTRENIYKIIADILLSQSKTLFMPAQGNLNGTLEYAKKALE